jgi:branched-subunit amino acid transport protein
VKPLLAWLLKFLFAALVVVVVVYVARELLAMVALPRPADVIVLLIIGVAVVYFLARVVGAPPGDGNP